MNKYITLLVILAIIPWLVSADCPDLSTLTPPTHGAYVLNTETNTTATVICNMGYFTDSMDVIAVTCTNSTWNVTNPITCQPNMNTCNPFTLPNGLASDDITRRLKLDTDDVATFTCEMGTLVGPSTTTCLPNGTWSYMGENSSCQGRLCGALPAQLTQPEHGFYEILNDTSGRNIQTGVVLRCEASYKPITSQFYAATCNPETGMWSEVNPGTCQLITCPYPFPYHLLSVWENEDPYMHVNINDVHTLVCYNTSATQTSRVLVGSASVRCQADGKWDNIVDLAPEEMMLPANATQCADIPCPLLTITNGYFKIENQMSTEDDTIVQTFCDMGYTLRSSMAKVARCSATTKQWSTDETALGSSSTSFVAPSCLPISQVGCSDMDLHTLFPGATYHFNDMNKMGNVSAPGMMVTFQCAEGYQVMGSNSTVCNMNETWAPLQANTRCVDTRTTIPPTNTTAMPNTTTTNTTTMPTLEPTFEPTSDPNTDIPTEAPAGDITNKAATSSSSSFVGSGGFIALVVVVPVAAVAIITILILMYYCRTRKTEKQDMKDRIKQDTLVGPADVCINMTTNPTTPTAKGAEVQPQPQPQPQALPGTVV